MDFKYNDKVIVTKGFYEGVVGHLNSYNNSTTYGIVTNIGLKIYIELSMFKHLEEEDND